MVHGEKPNHRERYISTFFWRDELWIVANDRGTLYGDDIVDAVVCPRLSHLQEGREFVQRAVATIVSQYHSE